MELAWWKKEAGIVRRGNTNKPKQRPTNILTKKPFASTRDVYELYHNAHTKAWLPLKKIPLCVERAKYMQTHKMRASPLIVHNFCAIYQLSLVTFVLLERNLNRKPILMYPVLNPILRELYNGRK